METAGRGTRDLLRVKIREGGKEGLSHPFPPCLLRLYRESQSVEPCPLYWFRPSFSRSGSKSRSVIKLSFTEKTVHLFSTSELRASMIRKIFHRIRSGIWELLLHNRHFPRSVSGRSTLRHMDMDRFQRFTFVCPEVHPIGANLKNLRHAQSLPAQQIPKSSGRWIQ